MAARANTSRFQNLTVMDVALFLTLLSLASTPAHGGYLPFSSRGDYANENSEYHQEESFEHQSEESSNDFVSRNYGSDDSNGWVQSPSLQNDASDRFIPERPVQNMPQFQSSRNSPTGNIPYHSQWSSPINPVNRVQDKSIERNTVTNGIRKIPSFSRSLQDTIENLDLEYNPAEDSSENYGYRKPTTMKPKLSAFKNRIAVDDTNMLRPPNRQVLDANILSLPKRLLFDGNSLIPPIRQVLDRNTLRPPIRQVLDRNTLRPPNRLVFDTNTLIPPVRQEPDINTQRPPIRQVPDTNTLRPPIRQVLDTNTLRPPNRLVPDTNTLRPPIRQVLDINTLRPPNRLVPDTNFNKPGTLYPSTGARTRSLSRPKKPLKSISKNNNIPTNQVVPNDHKIVQPYEPIVTSSFPSLLDANKPIKNDPLNEKIVIPISNDIPTLTSKTEPRFPEIGKSPEKGPQVNVSPSLQVNLPESSITLKSNDTSPTIGKNIFANGDAKNILNNNPSNFYPTVTDFKNLNTPTNNIIGQPGKPAIELSSATGIPNATPSPIIVLTTPPSNVVIPDPVTLSKNVTPNLLTEKAIIGMPKDEQKPIVFPNAGNILVEYKKAPTLNISPVDLSQVNPSALNSSPQTVNIVSPQIEQINPSPPLSGMLLTTPLNNATKISNVFPPLEKVQPNVSGFELPLKPVNQVQGHATTVLNSSVTPTFSPMQPSNPLNSPEIVMTKPVNVNVAASPLPPISVGSNIIPISSDIKLDTTTKLPTISTNVMFPSPQNVLPQNAELISPGSPITKTNMTDTPIVHGKTPITMSPVSNSLPTISNPLPLTTPMIQNNEFITPKFSPIQPTNPLNSPEIDLTKPVNVNVGASPLPPIFAGSNIIPISSDIKLDTTTKLPTISTNVMFPSPQNVLLQKAELISPSSPITKTNMTDTPIVHGKTPITMSPVSNSLPTISNPLPLTTPMIQNNEIITPKFSPIQPSNPLNSPEIVLTKPVNENVAASPLPPIFASSNIIPISSDIKLDTTTKLPTISPNVMFPSPQNVLPQKAELISPSSPITKTNMTGTPIVHGKTPITMSPVSNSLPTISNPLPLTTPMIQNNEFITAKFSPMQPTNPLNSPEIVLTKPVNENVAASPLPPIFASSNIMSISSDIKLDTTTKLPTISPNVMFPSPQNVLLQKVELNSPGLPITQTNLTETLIDNPKTTLTLPPVSNSLPTLSNPLPLTTRQKENNDFTVPSIPSVPSVNGSDLKVTDAPLNIPIGVATNTNLPALGNVISKTTQSAPTGILVDPIPPPLLPTQLFNGTSGLIPNNNIATNILNVLPNANDSVTNNTRFGNIETPQPFITSNLEGMFPNIAVQLELNSTVGAGEQLLDSTGIGSSAAGNILPENPMGSDISPVIPKAELSTMETTNTQQEISDSSSGLEETGLYGNNYFGSNMESIFSNGIPTIGAVDYFHFNMPIVTYDGMMSLVQNPPYFNDYMQYIFPY